MNEKFVCDICGAEHDADTLTRTADGNLVCEDCLSEKYAQCDSCGEWVPADTPVETSDSYLVCEDCLDSDYTYCEKCGEYHPNDEVHGVYTRRGSVEYWCEDCLDYNAFYCDHCNEWYDSGYYSAYDAPNGDVLCESCFDDLCCSCEECGETIWRDDAIWNDDRECYLCEDCADSCRNVINSYGYKPSPIFHSRHGEYRRIPEGETDLFFGIEDECDKGEDARTTAAEIQEITDALYIKHDGSLECGFEMVTHPCTLAYHMYQFPWKHICKTAIQHGFKSHDARTCGLHVHVGVGQFAPTEEEQDTIAGRIVLLVDRHWDALVKFSRRKENQLHWANRPNIPTYYSSARDYITAALRTRNGGRYQAVNLTNLYANRTIEFRLFNGTLKRDTIVATLQFLSNLCKYAMTHTTEEALASKFSDLVHYEAWKELDAYVQERSLADVADPAPVEIGAAPAEDDGGFHIGDRVMIDNLDGHGMGPVLGWTGTLAQCIASDASAYDWILRFDNPNPSIAHSCGGFFDEDVGYYVHTYNLRRI